MRYIGIVKCLKDNTWIGKNAAKCSFLWHSEVVMRHICRIWHQCSYAQKQQPFCTTSKTKVLLVVIQLVIQLMIQFSDSRGVKYSHWCLSPRGHIRSSSGRRRASGSESEKAAQTCAVFVGLNYCCLRRRFLTMSGSLLMSFRSSERM